MEEKLENTRKNFIIPNLENSVPQSSKERRKNFIITKRIAKHGRQSVIVITKILEEQLRAGTIAQLTIDVLEEASTE